MNLVPTHGSDRPAIYAGRAIDQVADTDLADAYTILDERDLTLQPSTIVDKTTVLIILDPGSFPAEAMAEDWWAVPLVVLLPTGVAAESLVETLGPMLFERIEYFDRIVSADSSVWEYLRRRYSWAESQRIPIETRDPAGAAVELRSLLEAEPAFPSFSGSYQREASRYRKSAGEAPATSAQHRDINGPCGDWRSIKAVHRAQTKVLRPQLEAARENRPEDALLDVLEVGAGAGRWAASFDLGRTRYSGVDGDESLVRAARSNFPTQSFDAFGPDLSLPYGDEAFDLVFTVDVMQRYHPRYRRILLSEMWRVARPAGRLLFLEDFVAETGAERSTVPMSVLEFVDLIIDVTDGQVVLEHVESVRYPHDDLVRAAALALRRLGVSKTR